MLRQRLAIEGDLRAEGGSSTYFDQYVERALKRFQVRQGLTPNGQLNKQTIAALNVPAAARLRQLKANLERLTSLAASTPRRYIVVNIPAAQIEAVFDDLSVRAVKTGMLANAAIVTAVADALERRAAVALVVDPVMVATSGDSLLEPAAVAALTTRLIPRATLITPNLPEAAALLATALAETPAAMEAQAKALLGLGCHAVLVKGGHRPGTQATDVFATAGGRIEHIHAPWIETRNTHGTGCTLSAAIVALLACGLPLEEAVRGAKRFLTAALEAAPQHQIGAGHGPVDHLFDIAGRPRPA